MEKKLYTVLNKKNKTLILVDATEKELKKYSKKDWKEIGTVDDKNKDFLESLANLLKIVGE